MRVKISGGVAGQGHPENPDLWAFVPSGAFAGEVKIVLSC